MHIYTLFSHIERVKKSVVQPNEAWQIGKIHVIFVYEFQVKIVTQHWSFLSII
jgi:hypothetical protein